jgi:hypothetical protein
MKKRRSSGGPNKQALTVRQTSGGLMVCRLHYAADADKNPATQAGKAWVKAALKGYAGGMQDPRWLKEMEIQYKAGAGQKVFPHLTLWLKDSNIFIDGAVDLFGARIYGSYDHGYVNPACYLVNAIYQDGMKRTLWEFYGEGVTVPDIARIIRGEDVRLPDGRRFQGNPYAGKEMAKIADPEIMRSTQVMAKGPNKSIAHLFAQERVHFIPGKKGDDGTVASWLTGNLWLDPDNPGYQIHRCCRNLIWELTMLQHRKYSSLQMRTRNQPEELLDKDNHAWDALKYWLKRFPVGVKAEPARTRDADFEFWMNLARKPKLKDSYVRDFAR